MPQAVKEMHVHSIVAQWILIRYEKRFEHYLSMQRGFSALELSACWLWNLGSRINSVSLSCFFILLSLSYCSQTKMFSALGTHSVSIILAFLGRKAIYDLIKLCRLRTSGNSRGIEKVIVFEFMISDEPLFYSRFMEMGSCRTLSIWPFVG